ncbi:hypothetical protein KAR91_24445 [Candidatus Pacearchaeota archaeon]|nr:hypothetical protein [Candidatus Pacearchaeota archaeon]
MTKIERLARIEAIIRLGKLEEYEKQRITIEDLCRMEKQAHSSVSSSAGLSADRKLRAFGWLEKKGSVDLIKSAMGGMLVDVKGTEILESGPTLLEAIEKAMSI